VTPLIFFLVILLFGLLAPRVVRALARQRGSEADWPFGFKKPLSRVEQVLYYRLVQTLPELVVLAQVPLSSFLRVRKGRTWNEWFNRISQKSIDFLVCERDFSVVMAIELDDATHDSSERANADKTKGRALTAAGVRLLRWRANALPDVETIRRIVDEMREHDSDGSEAVVARIEPSLHISHIEASNDPSIFHEETHQ
jgi:very-short-patch-repair endonuclease